MRIQFELAEVPRPFLLRPGNEDCTESKQCARVKIGLHDAVFCGFPYKMGPKPKIALHTNLLASFPRPPRPAFVACSGGRPGRSRHVIRAAIRKRMRGAVSPTSLRPHKLLPRRYRRITRAERTAK